MCEFKENNACNDNKPTGEKDISKSTVATVEKGGCVVDLESNNKSTVYFEQALEETKFGLFNYLIVLISGLILANVLLETLAISFVLPVSECDLHLTIQQRGALSAIGFVGIITSSHLWGFLADTTGRRNVIRPTLLLGFLVTVASSFASNFWALIVLRYINGFCVSGGSATVYAYLGEFHTNKNRSRAIMGAAFIFGLGAMLMPAIAWLVINEDWRLPIDAIGIVYKPWRFFMVVCGIPGFLCGLALFKIPESPKFLLGQGKEEKALQILQNIFHMNTGKPREEYPISNVIEDIDSAMKPKIKRADNSNSVMIILNSMWSQTQPLFNKQYLRTTILVCSIQFCIFITSNGLYMWFPHVLNSVFEFTKDHPGQQTYICDVVYEKQKSILKTELANANAFNSSNMLASMVEETCVEKLEIETYFNSLILEAMYAIGFAGIGFIISKISKMFILFVCLAGCGVCGIATVFVDNPTIAVYLYMTLLLCGLGINVLSAATVDLYPTRLRAMSVCISLMMGRLGSVVGANIFGALITNHCETAFLLSGSTLILSGLLGFLIPKPRLQKLTDSPRRNSIISMTGN